MKELSIFVDEPGEQNGISKYALMALVLHDQSDSIEEVVRRYEISMADKGLANIPFHASPLINGKHAYEFFDHEETASDVKIFGNAKFFKRNYLRLLRRKALS